MSTSQSPASRQKRDRDTSGERSTPTPDSVEDKPSSDDEPRKEPCSVPNFTETASAGGRYALVNWGKSYLEAKQYSEILCALCGRGHTVPSPSPYWPRDPGPCLIRRLYGEKEHQGMYHRDCFFKSLKGDRGLVEEYEEECRLQLTQHSYGEHRKWWRGQRHRASFLQGLSDPDLGKEQMLDWLSDRWSWAGHWNSRSSRATDGMGEERVRKDSEQVHAIAKKQALVMTLMLRHWGFSPNDTPTGAQPWSFPPVAVALSFYRSLSNFRFKQSDNFGRMAFPCKSPLFRFAVEGWLRGMSLDRYELGPRDNHFHFLPKPTNVGTDSPLLDWHTQIFKSAETVDTICGGLVSAGQVDILALFVPQELPHRWTTCRELMNELCASSRYVVSPLATARYVLRLLAEAKHRERQGETDWGRPYNGTIESLMASMVPELTSLALELRPEMEQEFLLEPFLKCSLECSLIVMRHHWSTPIVDWWPFLKAVLEYSTDRQRTHTNDGDQRLLIDRLVEAGVHFPKVYELTYTFLDTCEHELLEHVCNLDEGIVVDVQALTQNLTEWESPLGQKYTDEEEIALVGFKCQKCPALDVLCWFEPIFPDRHPFTAITPLCGVLLHPRPLSHVAAVLRHSVKTLNQVGAAGPKGLAFTPLQILLCTERSKSLLPFQNNWERSWWKGAVYLLLDYGADPNSCPQRGDVSDESSDSSDDDVMSEGWSLPPECAISPFVALFHHPLADAEMVQKFVDCGANASDPTLAQPTKLFVALSNATSNLK